jgi:parallel beta-helix repeat protein
MPVNRCVYKSWRTFVLCLCVLQAACGGGGGNGAGSGTPTPSVPLTPPLPTETPTPIRAGSNIRDALLRAAPGATVVVAPGSYGPLVLGAGDLQGPITLVADSTGLLTESPSAPVTINARGQAAAVMLTDQSSVTIDGFNLRGGAVAGVLVDTSTQIVVRNCTVTANTGDGVRVEQSADSLVFNNAVYANSGAGIRVVGSAGLQLFNNTVYGNQAGAIAVGDAETPSSDIVAENNIVNANTPIGIDVDALTTGYVGDFNINTDGYGEETPAGLNDLIGFTANPLFVSPSGGDFHVPGPDDFGGGGSPAIDTGDSTIGDDLVAALEQRSIQSDRALDVDPVDIGYHYLVPQVFTPTPLSVRTRTNTPGGAATVTRTRTPTPGSPTPTSTPPFGRSPTPTRTPRPPR